MNFIDCCVISRRKVCATRRLVAEPQSTCRLSSPRKKKRQSNKTNIPLVLLQVAIGSLLNFPTGLQFPQVCRCRFYLFGFY